MSSHYDAIVIGAGVGGMTLASDFAKRGLRVLCIDKGRLLSGNEKKFGAQELINFYRGGGLQAALGKQIVPIGEAQIIGGGSAINSGLIQRPLDEVWDNLNRLFNIRDWYKSDRDFFYKKAEDLLPLEWPIQGLQGKILIQGADLLSWKYKIVSHSSLGKSRASLFKLLHLTIEQSEGEIITAEPEEILQTSQGWKVSFINENGRSTVSAPKLFLAAGCMGTPRILFNLIAKKRFFKFNFKAHLFSKVLGASPSWSFNNVPQIDSVQINQFGPYQSMGCSISSMFLKKAFLAGKCSLQKIQKLSLENASLYYAMTSPTGSFASNGNWIYNSLTKSDIDESLNATQNLAKLLIAGGAENLIFPSGNTGVELIKLRDLALSSVHIFSSLPMGENSFSLVDSYGKVNGFKDLYVCDASIIPDCLGVNPQLSIMALALKVAHFSF